MVTDASAAASPSHLLGHVAEWLTLQVCSPEHYGRILRIRSPKCLVGSDPSCTLRLRGRGVRPFHCLILRGQAGAVIRRWSAATLLNGAGFTDAQLVPGDRLAVGPIELEVLEPSPIEDRHAARSSTIATHAPAEQEQELAERRRKLEAQQCELEELRRRTQQQSEQWEGTERQLREQLRAANDCVRETTKKCEAAESRLNELQSALADVSQQLTSDQQRGRSAQQERDARVAELSKWKDTAEQLRQELQQEREQHQRALHEWHVDRESLERELEERTETLKDVQKKGSRQMEAAEFLIHSLQQEGKQLLAQLEEAKQVIRQDSERCKRRSAVRAGPQTVRAEDDAARRTLSTTGSLPQRRPPAVQGDPPANSSRQAAVSLSSADPMVGMPSSGLTDNTQSSAPDVRCSESETAAEAPTPAGSPTIELDPDSIQVATENASKNDPALARTASATSQPSDGGTGAADTDAEGEDDEGVIQRYMERLLRRVATHGIEGLDEAVEPVPPSAVVPRQASPMPTAGNAAPVNVMVEQQVTRQAPAGVAQDNKPLAEKTHSVAAMNDAPLSPLQTHARTVDLLALRRLVHASAHRAISHSDRRRIIARGAGELIVALICFGCSGLMLAMDPTAFSARGVGVGLGLYFGAVVMLRGLRRLLACRPMLRDELGCADAEPGESDPATVMAVDVGHDDTRAKERDTEHEV